MTLPDIWASPFRCVSNELLADATRRPSTRAVMVPMRPMPSLTRSFDSALACSCGRMARRIIPRRLPATRHANTMQLIVRELMKHLRERSRCHEHDPEALEPEHRQILRSERPNTGSALGAAGYWPWRFLIVVSSYLFPAFSLR